MSDVSIQLHQQYNQHAYMSVDSIELHQHAKMSTVSSIVSGIISSDATLVGNFDDAECPFCCFWEAYQRQDLILSLGLDNTSGCVTECSVIPERCEQVVGWVCESKNCNERRKTCGESVF